MGPKRASAGTRRIRFMQHVVVDEAGASWDRVVGWLDRTEAGQVVDQVDRVLLHDVASRTGRSVNGDELARLVAQVPDAVGTGGAIYASLYRRGESQILVLMAPC